MFTGTYTAIVTPFKGGQVDYPALKRLISLQIKAGIDGIVPVGTTGESPTVNYEEHISIIAACVEYSRGRLKVMAGTGGNSTSEAIYLTEKAQDAGAVRPVISMVLPPGSLNSGKLLTQVQTIAREFEDALRIELEDESFDRAFSGSKKGEPRMVISTHGKALFHINGMVPADDLRTMFEDAVKYSRSLELTQNA